MVALFEAKGINDLNFGLRVSAVAKMDREFFFIGKLTRPSRELIKNSFNTQSILLCGPAENHKIISKKKMSDERVCYGDFDTLKVKMMLFFGKHSRKNINAEQKKRHGISLFNTFRMFQVIMRGIFNSK